MKYNKLHSVLVLLVLGCYFVALTPIHALLHTQDKEHHQCEQHHHDSHDDNEQCSYCDIVFCGQNIHLSASVFTFDAPSVLIFQIASSDFSQNLITSFAWSYLTLRAPPVS